MILVIKKIGYTILSTIILSLTLSFISYTPKVEQLSNTEYMGFSNLFILYNLFLGGIYLFFGVGISYFIDLKINQLIFNLISYLFAGVLIGGGFYFIFSPEVYFPELFAYILTGGIAALLFWGIQKVADKIFYNKLQKNGVN